MAGTIDMQDMRYLNLFEKITRVSTRYCFKYNEAIVFCVPRSLVSRAIGEKGINVKKMNEILNKRIKVIPQPLGIDDAKKFIESIVSPVTFKELEVNDEIILTAGSQSKAALIGRNKRRLLELQKISRDYFGKELKIV